MTIHVSSRRGTHTAGTEATTETHSPQPGTAGTASTRPSAARPQDVVVGQRISPEQARLLQLANGDSQPSGVCRSGPSEAELVQQYRATIAAGGTVQIPEAPPLPRRSGATLMRELNMPEPRLPAGLRALLANGSTPVSGWVTPRIIHAVEGALHRHLSDTAHLGIHLGVHAAALAAELSHIAAAVGHGSLAGAVGVTAFGTLLTGDATVGTVIETAIRLNNGTLPTPECIRELIVERGPEFVAALRAETERQLEARFHQGALAAARGEAPPADCDPAFRRGYSAGVEYRREHGCAFDEHARALRALNTATRGTARDASAGVVPIQSSQVERGRAGLIDREAFWNSVLAE